MPQERERPRANDQLLICAANVKVRQGIFAGQRACGRRLGARRRVDPDGVICFGSAMCSDFQGGGRARAVEGDEACDVCRLAEAAWHGLEV